MASEYAAEVEAFLFAAEGLDEKSSQALREADPEVQKAVLARGELTGARNPAAALLSRIRKASGGGKGGWGGATVDVETFIAENGPLDERAQEALRTAPGWVQEGVVAGGEVTNARNPSAALIARLKGVQTGGGWGSDPWGGAWGGGKGWGGDAWSMAMKGFGGKGWDMSWGKGGGGGWGGEAPARKGPVTLGSHGTCQFLTIPSTSTLVQNGMPAEVPTVEYDKTVTVFQSAAHILGDLVEDIKETCSFDFDPDWAMFPEIAQAWKDAGNEESCFMIAQCPSMGKWGIGVAPGWKNAERAGKLALAVALAHNTPQLAPLLKTYPDFSDFCKSAGLIEGAKEKGAKAQKSPLEFSSEAALMAGVVKPVAWEAPCPEVMWLTVAPTSRIVQEGLPADCPAIAWSKELQKYFSNSANILQELVPGAAEDVNIIHDADWTEFPDIGPLIQAVSGEESCYAIGTCASAAKWAVGVGSNWKAREASVKLALSIAIVLEDAAKVAELSKTYPEFGRLAKRNGLADGAAPPEKKPKVAGPV